MPARDPLSTTLSTKGQVILPKVIRESRRWPPGTRLIVEETPEGIMLKPAPLFAATRLEDVAGMLAKDGPVRSVEDMDEAIAREIRRRRAGD